MSNLHPIFDRLFDHRLGLSDIQERVNWAAEKALAAIAVIEAEKSPAGYLAQVKMHYADSPLRFPTRYPRDQHDLDAFKLLDGVQGYFFLSVSQQVEIEELRAKIANRSALCQECMTDFSSRCATTFCGDCGRELCSECAVKCCSETFCESCRDHHQKTIWHGPLAEA